MDDVKLFKCSWKRGDYEKDHTTIQTRSWFENEVMGYEKEHLEIIDNLENYEKAVLDSGHTVLRIN